jgi:hypothetical protein
VFGIHLGPAVTGITSIGVTRAIRKFYVWKSLGSNVNGVTAVFVTFPFRPPAGLLAFEIGSGNMPRIYAALCGKPTRRR